MLKNKKKINKEESKDDDKKIRIKKTIKIRTKDKEDQIKTRTKDKRKIKKDKEEDKKKDLKNLMMKASQKIKKISRIKKAINNLRTATTSTR